VLKGPFNILLYPFALIFGLIVRIRNYLYNTGILKSVSFDIPIISVGNLSAGGTGKTPHVEYLADLLGKNFRVAVLSRGYKRISRGFILSEKGSTASDIGDEPAQIKNKFPDMIVAVDENRVSGVRNIIRKHPDTEVIILDDAYQHRRISPGKNILLCDYNNRYTSDHLLPYGKLREHRKNSKRANYIIISRSPLDLAPIDRRIIVGEMAPLSHQHLYFTSVIYKEPVPFFDDTPEPLCLSKISETNRNILLLTGIAAPEYFYNYLSIYSSRIIHLKYPDHHTFTINDLNKINSEYNSLEAGNRCLITTEKDAARLKEIPNIADFIDKGTYYIPIGISFLNDDGEEFDNFISDYVKTNQSNSIISKEEGN
jgi:tetraacyldisaccharide 4'-kinase